MDTVVLLLSILLPLLLIGLFFGLRSGGGSRGDKLLVFGPMGSGKTCLYLQLRYGKAQPTFTSMQPTAARFGFHSALEKQGGPPPGPVSFVEMPGSGRLRPQLLGEAPSAAVLACVLDATRIAAQCKEAAGMLFDILTIDSVQRRAAPLIIVINKVDARGAGSAQAARAALEAEIHKVVLSRTSMVDTSDRAKRLSGIADASLGPFAFDQISHKVEFISASATKPDLGDFVSAVRKHIR